MRQQTFDLDSALAVKVRENIKHTSTKKARVMRPLIITVPGMLHAAYMPEHEREVVVHPGEEVQVVREGRAYLVEVEWRGRLWHVHAANLERIG